MIDPHLACARIDALKLALHCHESGLQNDGATVVETAEIFRDFIESE